MRLLLDTQILYWTFYDEARLPNKARELMSAATQIYVSPISIWELSIKTAIGKLKADTAQIVEKADASGFLELQVRYQHSIQVANLPLYHADPFDRMLVAQAIDERISLLTTDRQLSQYTDLVIHV